MKNARMVWLVMVLAVAVGVPGCRKKEPDTGKDVVSGVTPGVKPEMPTERVEEPKTPVTPPLGTAELSEGELSSALKDVYFDFDRYELRPDQRPTLEANGRWLLDHATQNVLIEGHCDERGTEEYNLALADRRANTAKDYLRALGVPATRMSTIPYGEAYPVDPGHDEGAWSRNRRAHFTLVAPKVGSNSGR